MKMWIKAVWGRVLRKAWHVTLVGLGMAAATDSLAYRFADRIEYQQPDGLNIELRGYGNEHHAVYETLDGYTVVFVPEFKAYFYAKLSESGDELVSSGLEVGKGSPESIALPLGLRVNPEAARQNARQRREVWESRLQLRERWARLKGMRSGKARAELLGPRYVPTLGTKVGLTLLIDFDDLKGTVARSNVVQFLNGTNYRANNNRGSVAQYFSEVSNGKLQYTNIVIGYIRIPSSLHPRSYYNDLNRVAEYPGNELVRDAIQVLTNQPNYQTEILPQLEALSANDAGDVMAVNILVAGADSGVWARGLWPHANNLFTVGPQELWPGGKKVNNYQMTTMTVQGSPMQIGVFCHETCHLLLGFPDLYDYDDQSSGGTGLYCLMNTVANPANPQHPCAYLKLMAGWATVTDLRPGDPSTFTLDAPGTNGTHILRYGLRDQPWEYFLIENRYRTGRDTDLPGSGILVWHIDEFGDSNNQNLLPNSIHANYEVTLVQADGRWHLQSASNNGDLTDPYYQGNAGIGYKNRLADDTNPSASWWNGTRSGLELRDFSTRGRQMTLTAEIKPPVILRDPLSQSVTAGQDLFLSVQMATNRPFAYTWLKGGVPLKDDQRVTGVTGPGLGIYNVSSADAGAYSVVISDAGGLNITSRVAQITISSLRLLASVDLGDASRISGSSLLLSNAVYVSAGGSGLLGSADNCRFLSEKVMGNFDVKVQVVDVNSEDGDSVLQGGAGLMVRAGLEPGSIQAAVLIRPGFLDQGQVQAFARDQRFSQIQEVAQSGGVPQLNNWVRLKREGDLVTMYYSTNGSRWDWLQTVPITLPAEAMVGIAATSYNPVTRVLAGLKSYSLQTNLPPTLAVRTESNSALEGSGERASLEVVSSRQGPVNVTYTLRDASQNGIRFERLSGQLTIPAGTHFARLEIVPIDNTTPDAPTVVTVSIDGSGVIQSSASVILFDDEERGRGLKKETYPSVAGASVQDLTRNFRYPGTAQMSTVTNFEANLNQGSGQVLSGYLTPPVTGAYTFYLAAANGAELWLSADSSAAKAVKIAEEPGGNTKRNWPGTVSKTHISVPINLEQGRWYYVRALHKAGFGTPHLGVAWQAPGQAAPAAGSAPISGEFLSWSLPKLPVVPTPNLRLTSSAGRLLLSVSGGAQASSTLEASNDLVTWRALLSGPPIGDLDLLNIDPAATPEGRRFYRLMPPSP